MGPVKMIHRLWGLFVEGFFFLDLVFRKTSSAGPKGRGLSELFLNTRSKKKNPSTNKPQTSLYLFSNTRGFSLFEVLIAMAIMASASLLLYVAWSGNQVRVQKMAINNKAAFLLEQIISDLEIKYGRKLTQLPENEEGVFEDSPRFTWLMESKEFEMPDLSSLLITEGDGNEMMLMVITKLTDHLNQSIKEMKVTVRYTLGKKSVDYSATTFLVDFERSIPLAIPGGAGGGP